MKGITTHTQVIAVTIIHSVIILGLLVNYVSTLDQKGRLETLPVVDNRIESTIYTASGLEEGKIQMEMTDEYGLNREGGDIYVNYTAGSVLFTSSSRSRELEPPVDLSLSGEGKSSSFCIEKNSGISIRPGEC